MQGFSSLDRMKTAENVKRAAVGSTVSIRFDSIRFLPFLSHATLPIQYMMV